MHVCNPGLRAILSGNKNCRALNGYFCLWSHHLHLEKREKTHEEERWRWIVWHSALWNALISIWAVKSSFSDSGANVPVCFCQMERNSSAYVWGFSYFYLQERSKCHSEFEQRFSSPEWTAQLPRPATQHRKKANIITYRLMPSDDLTVIICTVWDRGVYKLHITA